jgi:hypothetical protein
MYRQLGGNMRCVLASTTLSATDLENRLKVSVQLHFTNSDAPLKA